MLLCLARTMLVSLLNAGLRLEHFCHLPFYLTIPNYLRLSAAGQQYTFVLSFESLAMGPEIPQTIAETTRCSAYCCSAFANFQDTGCISTDCYNLDNTIHPLFSKDRFPSGLDYEAMVPSLRLATHLLDADAVVEYCTAMVHGKVFNNRGEEMELRGLSGNDCDRGVSWTTTVRCAYTSHTDKRTRAEELLQRLSHVVRFDILTHPEDIHTSHAQCQPLHGPLSGQLTSTFRGCGSSIFLNPRELDRLATLSYRKKNRKGHQLLAFARFSLAVLLIHELAHSIQLASFGSREHEVMLPDWTTDEAGHELISSIFGGIIDCYSASSFPHLPQDGEQTCKDMTVRRAQHESAFVILRPWPCLKLVKEYALSGTPIVYTAPPRPCWDQLIRINSSFIESLFTNEFWNEAIPRRGASALHPASVGSWSFWLTADAEYEPLTWQSVSEMFTPQRAHRFMPCPDCPTGGKACMNDPQATSPEDFLADVNWLWPCETARRERSSRCTIGGVLSKAWKEFVTTVEAQGIYATL
jgi:hypothetical protein